METIFWADPPKEVVVLVPKKFLEASRVPDTYPQSFGYFLIKSNSWRLEEPTEKQIRRSFYF